MPDVSEKIVENLRYLRRYARALLGSQQTGDTYVRICLEDLLQEPDRISATGDVRLQLFRLFHDVWSRTGFHDREEGDSAPSDLSVEARLQVRVYLAGLDGGGQSATHGRAALLRSGAPT